MVNNNGPAEATAVSLADSLPPGLTPTPGNGAVSQGNYDGTIWDVGTLPPSTSATLTLEGIVEAGYSGSTITNTTAAAAGDQPDIYTAGDDLTESVIVEGVRDIPLVDWLSPSGGVTVTDNSLNYSGVPTGWSSNSVNSVPFSVLGVFNDYSVRWTVASDPGSTTWVVGLGVTESGRNWRDVDYGLRSSEGDLKVYENGVWRSSSANLKAGDMLEIYVKDTQIEYRLNGAPVYSTSIQGDEDFYLDTSFKQGAIDLASFALVAN
jgi:hypothetical protein